MKRGCWCGRSLPEVLVEVDHLKLGVPMSGSVWAKEEVAVDVIVA